MGGQQANRILAPFKFVEEEGKEGEKDAKERCPA